MTATDHLPLSVAAFHYVSVNSLRKLRQIGENTFKHPDNDKTRVAVCCLVHCTTVSFSVLE